MDAKIITTLLKKGLTQKTELKENWNKKSQVTIFIILALILVVGIVLIFVIREPAPELVLDEKNPQLFIESCTKDAVEEAVNILIKQGGDIEPKGSIMYQSKSVAYLCYNANYYNPCINQRPLLIKHVEDEIIDYIKPRILNCFKTLKASFENRYEINMGDMNLKVDLKPNQVGIEIDRYFKMARGENVREFNNFKINLVHPLYELVEISNEITNQEAKFCFFNTDGFNANYPGFMVRKDMIDNSKIYLVKERDSNQEFIFAIRGCVMPAGL